MKKTIIALGLMMAMGAAFEGCQLPEEELQ